MIKRKNLHSTVRLNNQYLAVQIYSSQQSHTTATQAKAGRSAINRLHMQIMQLTQVTRKHK